MKRKGTIRLQQKKQELKAKQAMLEESLEADWETLRTGVSDGTYLWDIGKSFLYKKIPTAATAGDILAASAGRLAIRLVEKLEALLTGQVEKWIEMIRHKVDDWLDDTDDVQVDE